MKWASVPWMHIPFDELWEALSNAEGDEFFASFIRGRKMKRYMMTLAKTQEKLSLWIFLLKIDKAVSWHVDANDVIISSLHIWLMRNYIRNTWKNNLKFVYKIFWPLIDIWKKKPVISSMLLNEWKTINDYVLQLPLFCADSFEVVSKVLSKATTILVYTVTLLCF